MSIDLKDIKCSFPNREDMQNKISLLEKKIFELEGKISRLNCSHGCEPIIVVKSNADETYKKIMKECSGNIWRLKDLIFK